MTTVYTHVLLPWEMSIYFFGGVGNEYMIMR